MYKIKARNAIDYMEIGPFKTKGEARKCLKSRFKDDLIVEII